MWKHVDLIFSRTEACLQTFGSETLDINLCIVYSKLGLDITAAGKFPKQNGGKINNNDGKTGIDTNESIIIKDKNKITYQVKTSRRNPWNKFSHRVQLV